MRYCPACGTQYTDDTLRFCLQDGSQLVDSLEADPPTVAFDETPTVLRQRNPAAVTRSDFRQDPVETAPERRSIFVPLLIAGITGAVLFVAGAIATWVFLSGGREAMADNSANVNAKTPAPPKFSVPTPSPRTSVTASPAPTSSASEIDIEHARRDISQVIERWRSDTENLNLNSYMENYARTVDYYNRRGASRTDVRNDKARAFDIYDSIRMNLDDIRITVDQAGNVATAEFDKEWDFQGARNSSGRVRSQLRFRRDGERWLIVGERDLKVY
jgi:hypothetical protein